MLKMFTAELRTEKMHMHMDSIYAYCEIGDWYSVNY